MYKVRRWFQSAKLWLSTHQIFCVMQVLLVPSVVLGLYNPYIKVNQGWSMLTFVFFVYDFCLFIYYNVVQQNVIGYFLEMINTAAIKESEWPYHMIVYTFGLKFIEPPKMLLAVPTMWLSLRHVHLYLQQWEYIESMFYQQYRVSLLNIKPLEFILFVGFCIVVVTDNMVFRFSKPYPSWWTWFVVFDTSLLPLSTGLWLVSNYLMFRALCRVKKMLRVHVASGYIPSSTKIVFGQILLSVPLNVSAFSKNFGISLMCIASYIFTVIFYSFTLFKKAASNNESKLIHISMRCAFNLFIVVWSTILVNRVEHEITHILKMIEDLKQKVAHVGNPKLYFQLCDLSRTSNISVPQLTIGNYIRANRTLFQFCVNQIVSCLMVMIQFYVSFLESMCKLEDVDT